MIRIVLLVMTTLFSIFVEAQTNYEKDMQMALDLFEKGNLEESSKLFEKISETQKESWLPNYYIALSNSLLSFDVSDKEQKVALLEKAEKFLQKASEKQPNNAEIMIVQALIYTGWIVYDPMTYGQRNFNTILELYTKAKRIDPKNPRVAYQSVQFDMNSVRYMGGSPEDFCKDLEKAIELFATFKPETKFHPNWGLSQATELQQQCKN